MNTGHFFARLFAFAACAAIFAGALAFAEPDWSLNRTNFTSLAYTPGAVSLEFNTTWTTAGTIDTVLIGHNLSSPVQNHTVSAFFASEYYYRWAGMLAAGSYFWKEYANNTISQSNETNTFFFNVGKAASSIYLYLNGSRANFQIGGGEGMNATAVLQSPSQGSVSIRTNYSDGADKEWASGSSPLENTTALSAAGVYYFNATFSGNENYSGSSESWTVTVLQPYLEVSLTTPPVLSPTEVVQNATFRVNATVTCRQGFCGTVNGTVRYNASGPDPNTPVSISYGATPVFVNETPALAEKACGAMYSGNQCNLSWILNASGNIGANIALGVLFNGTAPGVLQNHTQNATISLMSCVVYMTTSWAGIDFGTLLPSAGNAAPGNNAGLYNITVNAGSCDTDIYIKGTNITNETFSSYIPSINLSWSNTTNSYAAANAMQLSYLPVSAGVAAGTNVTTWYWLDVPPVYAGKYNGTIYVLGVRNGQSPY